MKRVFFILFFNIIGSIILFAQSNTSSPYSMFGIGDIKPLGFGRSIGLGGAGIALPSDVSLNNINPASYSAMDSLAFKFETGVDMNVNAYSKGGQSQVNHNVNFSYLAIGFRNTKWWANSIGLAPYSGVGNDINTKKNIEGSTDEMNVNFKGSGGLNQVYWGNAFRIFPKLSVGVNMCYVFGSITQSQNITASSFDETLTTSDRIFLNRLFFNYGFQYKFTIKNKIQATVGGIAGTPQQFHMSHDITTTTSALSSALEENEGKISAFELPAYYGIGVALKTDRFLFTTDYRFENWSDSKSSQSNIKFVDARKFMVGMEYTPAKSFRDPYYKKITYRIGAFYSDSYMKIYDQQLHEKGLSFGFGIPMMQKKMYFNIAYQIGTNGVDNSNRIINETFHRIVFNVSLSDFWFIKPKFD